MVKRKTVTFPSKIYDIIKNQSDLDRLELYDTLFRHLFEIQPINKDEIKSPKVAAFLEYLAPELRILQTKFDNRNGKKNLIEPSNSFSVQTKNIGTYRNESEQIENFSSDYYNIIYIIKEIIYNYQSINQKEILNKYKYIKNDKLGLLNQSLSQIEQSVEKQGINKITHAVEKLAAAEFIKVNGITKPSIEVLDKIIGLLIKPTASEQIKIKLKELSEVSGIKNPVNYLISSLYNLACDFEKDNRHGISTFYSKNQPVNNNVGFMTHDYTKEQLEALYDSVDDVDI